MSVTLKYFNEYAYYNAVTSVSRRAVEAGGKPLTTTQARELRSRFEEALQRQDKSITSAGKGVMLRALDETFRDYVPSVFASSDYDGLTGQFSAMTGIASTGSRGQRALTYGRPVVPLSPFDPTFSDRDAFMRNGAQLLYANRDDIMDGAQNRADVPQDSVVLMRARRNELQDTDYRLLSEADKSGAALLAPYMSEDEYAAASVWLEEMGADDNSRYMSREALQRSAGVLRMMKEAGISYQVLTDENPGQLVARIDGTRINVRLTDSRQNEQFVGRVYDDGHVYRYITNKPIDSNSHQTEAYTPRSAQECFDLLRYAMGESVQRWDGIANVGTVVTQTRRTQRWSNNQPRYVSETRNTAYHSAQNASYMVGPLPGDNRYSVFIHADNNRGQSNVHFASSTQSDQYLQEAVSSARQNFASEVRLEELIAAAEAHKGEEGDSFDYSGDDAIASIQRGYWDILTSDEEVDVYHPGAKYDEYIDSLNESEDEDAVTAPLSLDDIPRYEGTPSEKVRQHMQDNLDYFIGTFEPDAEGKRFDPVNVSQYMSSSYGTFANNRNIIAALRASDISADELRGNNFYNNTVKDNLVKFDEATASPMYMSDSPFVRSMFDTIVTTIRESGCEIEDRDVLMDANGIVHYTVQRISSQSLKSKTGESTKKPFTGEIGQIFVPREDGMVETKYAGSGNYLFVPGYEASVVTGASTAEQTMEQRTKLRGYEQAMRENIAHTIRGDMLSNYDEVGTPTSVNSTYRQLYAERHPLDWVEQTAEEGMDDELRTAIIQTEARRVKYGKEFRDGSTVNADYRANQYTQPGQIVNDNFYSAYNASGRRNVAILSEEGDGYFDKTMTSSGMEQGITRYMCEGTKVDENGFMIRSDKDDAAPLMKYSAFQFSQYDPWDRRLMTSMNAIKASRITPPTKVALTTLDGMNSNDGFIVSSEFAQMNPIRLPNGLIRPLEKGDKISDMHGNKGVISVVIDPDMDPEEAKKQNLTEAVKVFKNNPGLAVVGAPFSGVSRYNAGSVREMMSGKRSKLVGPDGEDLGTAVGEMRFIITHLSSDKKSSVYDPEMTPGKGRKAGAQMGMSITAMDCPALMREFYGNNAGKLRNLREVVIAFGGDISETGQMRDRYTPHASEKRKVFGMPDLEYTVRNTKSGPVQVLDVNGMKKKFGMMISRQGGFLELPFPLKYPDGREFDKLTEDEHVTVNYQKLEWQVQRHNEDGTVTTYTAHRHEDANAERSALKHEATYAMPIVSSHLRSEQDFEDGTTHLHDYTTNYIKVFEAAVRYREAMEQNNRAEAAKYQRAAQAEYSRICDSLDARFISSKKNLVRDGVMSAQVPNSATLVWNEDTSLPLDTVKINREKMAVMGLEESADGGPLMVRDPVLSEAGIMCVRVIPADDIQGVSVNPAVAPRFEGDFDGDTVGVNKLNSGSAQREAVSKFALEAALLNKEKQNEDGSYSLNLEDGLDIASAHHHFPELADRFEQMRLRANEIDSSDMSDSDKLAANRELIQFLNDHYRTCYAAASCKEVLRIDSAEGVIQSIQEMVDHGTKGSHAKLAKFATCFGVEFRQDEDGRIILDTIKDKGESGVTREDDYNSQICTATKSCGTGIAGRYQHRGTMAFRNSGVEKEVLHLTHPVTQALLQLKHEDKETAYRMYDLLQTSVRSHWRGQLLEEFQDEHGATRFRTVTGEDGKPVQATREQWVEQTMKLYTSKHGLNVKINPDDVVRVSHVMEEYGEGGRVADVETCQSYSLMDKMAYDGSRDVLYDAIKDGRSLAEGEQSGRYMPTLVQKNIRAAERGEEVKGFVAADTREDYKPKEKVSPAAPKTRKRPSSDILKVQDIPNGGETPGTDTPDVPQ